MTTQTSHNRKQSLRPWVSMGIGLMLSSLFVIPAMLNTLMSETWFAVPLAERRVIAWGGILVIAIGFGLAVLADRYFRTHQRYNIVSMIFIMLGAALMLAGGAWMMFGFNQQI